MTSHNVTGRYSSKVTGNAVSVFISQYRHERFQGRDEIMGLLCIFSTACYQIRAYLTAPIYIDSIPEALASSSIYDTRCFMYRIYQVVEIHHLPTYDLLKFTLYCNHCQLMHSIHIRSNVNQHHHFQHTETETKWTPFRRRQVFPVSGILVWNDIGFVSLT